MTGMDEQKRKDIKLLKEYLSQYYISSIKRLQLERRLRNIREEMNTPIGGRGYSPVNYGGTNKVGPGAASFVYRMSEIESRIEEQKNRAEKNLLKIMDIMDFLEESSMERMVLELRFIDCDNWEDIAKEIHLGRRTCIDYQNKAFEKLLGFKKVRSIIQEYQREKDENGVL